MSQKVVILPTVHIADEFYASSDWQGQLNGLTDDSNNCVNTGVHQIPETGTEWSISITINYSKNQVCHWWIYNPNPSGTVELYFSKFNSESCDPGCDYLLFYMGTTTGSHYLGIWRGNLYVEKFKWSVPYIYLRWESDYDITRSAMTATITYKP